MPRPVKGKFGVYLTQKQKANGARCKRNGHTLDTRHATPLGAHLGPNNLIVYMLRVVAVKGFNAELIENVARRLDGSLHAHVHDCIGDCGKYQGIHVANQDERLWQQMRQHRMCHERMERGPQETEYPHTS